MPMQTQLDLRFATLQIQTLWKETVSLRAGISQGLVSPIENPLERR
jgi:hypothetical protein